MSPYFRGRIGRDERSGHYAVPRRYRLHLSLSCPDGLRIAVTHSLFGLERVLPRTLLPAVPDRPDGGYEALRPLYEASSHQHQGPPRAPVLSDGWSGRIVSDHTPDILRDLAERFGGRPQPGARTAAAHAAIGRLCEEGVDAAAQRAGQRGGGQAGRAAGLGTLLSALGDLEQRLAARPFVLGRTPDEADVRLWVTLVRLDTVHRWHLDAAAVHRIADHPRLWGYARRLAAHPAFGPHLDLAGIARRHHAGCRGLEAAGAAVRIVDWETARCGPLAHPEAATAGTAHDAGG